MVEKELIAKIKELSRVKPRENWVFELKSQILNQHRVLINRRNRTLDAWQIIVRMFFQPRMALAGILTIFTLLGVVFNLSQRALPGDPLYIIKRVNEKAQAVFVSSKEQPQAQLELMNKRLDELARIAESNQVRKLAPAIQEYQASAAQATKNLAKTTATSSDSLSIKKIAEQTQKLAKTKEKLEKIYGIAGLGTDESADPIKAVAEWLINDLENRTLSEEQEIIFDEAKEEFQAGNYNSSLIKILQLSELRYPQD